MKLFDETAHGIDFRDTWHRAHLRPDDPVLNFAQIGQLYMPYRPVFWASSSASTVHMKISPNPVEIGPIVGSMPTGNRSLCFLNTLAHQLARKVDIGAILENNRDL